MKTRDVAGNVVEDFKGYQGGPSWALFRVKAKLVEALYGIPVTVVTK